MAKRDAMPDENPVGWLVVVARNELLWLLRKRSAESPAEPPASGGATVAAPALALEVRERLRLLNSLGEHQRVALSLRAAGYSYAEIAGITGKTYTWTNRHISEALARLRTLSG